MNGSTYKGLYYLMISFIISAVFSLIISTATTVIQDESILLVISFLGIFALVAFVLLIVGAVNFLKGKKEFGEKHQKNVDKAVIIFIINIFVTIVLSSVLTYLTISTMGSPSTEQGNTFVPLTTMTLTFISAVLGSLIYYFALIELENETGKTVLYTAMICSIAISVVTSLYVSGMVTQFLGELPTDTVMSPPFFNQNFGIIGILSSIPGLLYIYALYIPYKRIKEKDLIPTQISVDQQANHQRYCTNCGRAIPFDANICPYCAKRFETY